MIEIKYKQVNSINNLPVFATENYLKCKSANYGWFVSEEYIIPFIIDKRYIFKRMMFTYEPIKVKNHDSTQSKDAFLKDVIEKVKVDKICHFISMAQSYVVFDKCPDNCDKVEWGSYIVDVNKSDDDLLMSCHAKHRNVIKKASKENVLVEETSDINLVFHNIKDTLERQNSIFYPSLDYLKSLLRNIPDNVSFFIAKKEDVVQGTAIIIYDGNCGYYMYGGSIPKPSTGSVNLLQFEVMRFLRNKGINSYDLVGARLNVKKGTKYEGIQRFKSRFGASLKEGYSFRVVFNPFLFKLFNSIVKLYGALNGFKYSDQFDQLKSGEY